MQSPNFDLLQYLARFKDLYPGGVPQVLETPKRRRLCFLGSPVEVQAPEARQLLQDAAIKGLKLKEANFQICTQLSEADLNAAIVVMGAEKIESLPTQSVVHTHSPSEILSSQDKKREFWQVLQTIVLSIFVILSLFASKPAVAEPHVAVIEMDMLILPGTRDYLKNSILQAAADGAEVLVVTLDTPGGMLETTQEMIQEIFKSPIPVIIYVSPTGGTAASAGVFITLAGHVAAMAPGTSIGAAHPVSGDGKDIEGDMRQKAENMTIAMVKSISEQRGRNVEWAEKSVKESSSLTEKEALKIGVVDLVAENLDALLAQVKGKTVTVGNSKLVLKDYSKLPRKVLDLGFKERVINTLANPNVAALLMLGATTGLTLELYNPGAILPGVVGVICLILALTVSQIIPISQGGVILMVLGAMMIAAELWIPSGALAIGGVIAIVLGSIYFIDPNQAPGLSVSLEIFAPLVFAVGFLLLYAAREVTKSLKAQPLTGAEGLIGLIGNASENFTGRGRVFVNGENWTADLSSGLVQKGDKVKVVKVLEGLVLVVEKVS